MPSPGDIALLFGGTLVGETLGSIVGGSSFVVQPVVLVAGFTMHQAIALDVSASCITSIAGLATLRTAGRLLSLRDVVGPMTMAILGALIGPVIMAASSSATLAWVFAIAAILVATLNWLPRSVSRDRDEPNLFPVLGSAFALGIYTGLSGAGAGILAVVLLTRSGLTTISAVVMRKFLFVPATIVSAASYAWHGLIPWAAFLPMAIACALGGWIGTTAMLRIGEVRIASVFRVAALGLAVVTIWAAIHRR